MLTITVSVGDRVVAKATAGNVSNLADISDYEVRTVEQGYAPLQIPYSHTEGKILGHQRSSSVWSLVGKIAELALKKESDV